MYNLKNIYNYYFILYNYNFANFENTRRKNIIKHTYNNKIKKIKSLKLKI